MTQKPKGGIQTVSDATTEEVKASAKAVEVACEGQHEPNQKRTRSQKRTVVPVLSGLIDSVGDPAKYTRRKVSVMDGTVGKDYIVGFQPSSQRLPLAGHPWVCGNVDADGGAGIFEGQVVWDLAGEVWDAGMTNVGPYLHGSDMSATRIPVKCQTPTQRTITHIYAKEGGRKERMVGYIRHQVVLCQLCLPLEAFRNSKHLTSIMCDIAKALSYVHRAGFFHHDLSVPNIMIDTAGNGQLVDFDLARCQNEKGARQSIRTGTWQFMSTTQLLIPGKEYKVSDKLESIFFITLYEGIHWMVHNKPAKLDLELFFDQVGADMQTGGAGKHSMYTVPGHADVVLRDPRFEKSPPFTYLIRELFLLFQSLAWVNSERGRSDDVANVEKLKNCDEVVRLMEEAMQSPGWPGERDKAPDDNYSRDEGIEEDLAGRASLKEVVAGPSKRGREAGDDNVA